MDDGQIISAVIGAVGTVAAAFAGVVTWYLASRHQKEKERAERQAALRQEAGRREQRVLDLVVAIHSEILAGIVANRQQLTPEEARYALANPTPFATADDTDFVFEAVNRDITILSEEVIHSVVQYYRIARQSNLMTKDLRDPTFLAQKPAEKRKFIRTLLEIVELQKLWGEAALDDLEQYASGYDVNLAERRVRAEALFDRARSELSDVFKQSDESDRSSGSKPPGRKAIRQPA